MLECVVGKRVRVWYLSNGSAIDLELGVADELRVYNLLDRHRTEGVLREVLDDPT